MNKEFFADRRGKPWSNDEQNQLLKEIQKKIPIEMIAELHGRTNGGITSRLREIAANYYFNNNLQVPEIQKYTGLTFDEISDAIARREVQKQVKEQKQKQKEITNGKEKEKKVISPKIVEEVSDTKEIISLLKDIKVLLEKFLNNIHYEE